MLKSKVAGSLDAIDAPPFDFQTICARAAGKDHSTAVRSVFPRRWLVGVLLVALPCVAAAAAYFAPLAVTHRYGTWQLYGGPSQSQLYPAPQTLRAYAAAAMYKVTWPSGLPRADRLWFASNIANEVFILEYACPRVAKRDLMRAPLEHSTLFVIVPAQYASINPRLAQWVGDQDAGFWLKGRRARSVNADWITGDERVHTSTLCLSKAQITGVKQAMGGHDVPVR